MILTRDSKIIEWNEELSVGIASMDNQHRMLLMMINDICTGQLYCGQFADARFVTSVYQILDFFRKHFVAEELVMEKIKYRFLEKHRQQHRQLLKILLSLLKKYTAGQQYSSFKFIRFLRGNVLNHVAVFDKKYGNL
ncbi:MAG: bacteriohemerythrin [Treponema sp.]|jgi:hemerythrin-like metal-binding protein|nr:bacteriohemerythrin [Treponema sp.]